MTPTAAAELPDELLASLRAYGAAERLYAVADMTTPFVGMSKARQEMQEAWDNIVTTIAAALGDVQALRELVEELQEKLSKYEGEMVK